MELALFVIFIVVVSLMFVTTLIASILAYRDIDGKKLVTGVLWVVVGAEGSTWMLFSSAGTGSEGLLIFCGIISFVLICVLWLMHVLCAVTAKSRWFGWTALVVDIVCAVGMVVMLVLGLM